MALCLACLPHLGHSEEVNRIEDILRLKTYGANGDVLVSENRAHVEGCVIRLELEKPGACEAGASFFSMTKYIDVQALVADLGSAEFKDFSGARYESLKGAVSYRYRSQYFRELLVASDTERKISNEEYANFPTDVASRLKVLSRRYREEIDPKSYSRSAETTRFCSGVEFTKPFVGLKFSFYVEPSEANEFAALIEELSQTCSAIPNS